VLVSCQLRPHQEKSSSQVRFPKPSPALAVPGSAVLAISCSSPRRDQRTAQRDQKMESTGSPCPAGHSRVCGCMQAPACVPAPTAGSSTCPPVPAHPDPPPWGSSQQLPPRGSVPSAGMLKEGKDRAARGAAELEEAPRRRADAQELSHSKLRSGGGFTRQGETCLPSPAGVAQQLLGFDKEHA